MRDEWQEKSTSDSCVKRPRPVLSWRCLACFVAKLKVKVTEDRCGYLRSLLVDEAPSGGLGSVVH